MIHNGSSFLEYAGDFCWQLTLGDFCFDKQGQKNENTILHRQSHGPQSFCCGERVKPKMMERVSSTSPDTLSPIIMEVENGCIWKVTILLETSHF